MNVLAIAKHPLYPAMVACAQGNLEINHQEKLNDLKKISYFALINIGLVGVSFSALLLEGLSIVPITLCSITLAATAYTAYLIYCYVYRSTGWKEVFET